MFFAHGTYSVPEAKRFCRDLEDCNLRWFEEPINSDNRHGTAAVRGYKTVQMQNVCSTRQIYFYTPGNFYFAQKFNSGIDLVNANTNGVGWLSNTTGWEESWLRCGRLYGTRPF